MKPSEEIYNSIPALTSFPCTKFFMHIPGVYCRNCGEDFALYSFSVVGADGLDENGKPYMNRCFKCNPNWRMPTR